MKKMMVFTVAALALNAAFAMTYFAAVNTAGAKGETEGPLEGYSAYYCTQTKAKELFDGNDTYSTIAAYLATDQATYNTAMGKLAKDGTKLSNDQFVYGEYSFSQNYSSPLAGGEYLAIVAFSGGEKDMFRVFGNTASGGSLLFAPGETGGGGASDWVTVPEPTSGALALFALAALALKRKRA